MKLKNKYKKQIIELARTSITVPFELWGYGSRVNGDSHSTSDLDILVKSKEQIKQSELTKFINSLKDSNIPMLVDVLDWHSVPIGFQKNIDRNHEVLV